MEFLTVKKFKNGSGFFSQEYREEFLRENNLNDDDILVNFAFTDYGGDFFDRIAIDFFIDRKEENFIYEKTCYYGKNGILFGKTASDFKEVTEYYLLGYENIEDFYNEKTFEIQQTTSEDFLNDFRDENGEELDEETKKDVFSFMVDVFSNYHILSSGQIDFCESDVEEKLQEFLDGEYKLILSARREEKINNQYYDVIK